MSKYYFFKIIFIFLVSIYFFPYINGMKKKSNLQKNLICRGYKKKVINRKESKRKNKQNQKIKKAKSKPSNWYHVSKKWPELFGYVPKFTEGDLPSSPKCLDLAKLVEYEKAELRKIKKNKKKN